VTPVLKLLGFSLLWRMERRKMSRTELIIQLLKVAIALAFGAYFVWWSLQVLARLTPDYDGATAMVDPIFKLPR
jgi:ABC-type nickel/cobalt efflux system permease component RcnA